MPKTKIIRKHDAEAELETLRKEKAFLQKRNLELESESVVNTWIKPIDEDIARNSMKLEEKAR